MTTLAFLLRHLVKLRCSCREVEKVLPMEATTQKERYIESVETSPITGISRVFRKDAERQLNYPRRSRGLTSLS